MFATLRTLAPAVLLLSALSGQAAAGAVLVHVASEHAAQEGHAGHAAPDHHAGDHHSEAGGEHGDADHGSGHTHQIVHTSASAPARVTCPSVDVQPCLPAVGQGRSDRPAPCALLHLALPVLRAGPPQPQRHPILLL